MKTNFICSLVAGLSIVTGGFLFTHTLAAGDPAESNPLAAFARKATSTDTAESGAAIQALRAAGPAGLKALSGVYSNQIALHSLQARQASPGKVSAPDENWERISAAFDAVGEQRDCYVSQLFWFTDLDQAKAAARDSGKPILSLRLLGKLNEEYSCANSRFFRTTLYANTQVAEYLRDHFILHWQSVRPVPRITIDMGDGRKIERTITGNSIHYILDAEGNPIDALPGLYGARTFLEGLKRAETAEQQASKFNGDAREAFLKNYRETRLAEIQQQWSRDLAQAGDAAKGSQPDTASDATWKAISALHADGAWPDASAYNLIARKEPQSMLAPAMRRTASKAVVETPMMRMINHLQHSIAEDTVRNEYQFHTRILEWLASGGATQNLDTLNRKIYAELFLTPDSDPWLGLAPADIFSALDHGGLVESSTSR